MRPILQRVAGRVSGFGKRVRYGKAVRDAGIHSLQRIPDLPRPRTEHTAEGTECVAPIRYGRGQGEHLWY